MRRLGLFLDKGRAQTNRGSLVLEASAAQARVHRHRRLSGLQRRPAVSEGPPDAVTCPGEGGAGGVEGRRRRAGWKGRRGGRRAAPTRPRRRTRARGRCRAPFVYYSGTSLPTRVISAFGPANGRGRQRASAAGEEGDTVVGRCAVGVWRGRAARGPLGGRGRSISQVGGGRKGRPVGGQEGRGGGVPQV